MIVQIARFPSPPGTSYFLIITDACRSEAGIVSVPSGDFLFSNKRESIGHTCKNVSVPSGDFLFSNFDLVQVMF